MEVSDRDRNESLPMGAGVVKNLATAVSRRQFGKATAVVVAAMTLGAATPIPAAAAACTWCQGSCALCGSSTGNCCSPNGRYCYSYRCWCNVCPWCLPFRAWETVCDDGRHGGGCLRC
jgi:hypothetical protein